MHSDDRAIRARVLRAIAANRLPGLHFPGHFLDIQWKEVAGGAARATLEDGPHCRNADGTINLIAIGMLADNTLAASTRTGLSPGSRLGTTHLGIQFTGAPAQGTIEAESLLLGFSEGTGLRQSLSRGTLCAQGRPLGHISGQFVFLDPPPGMALGPLPYERSEPPTVETVDPGRLAPHEATVLRTCEAALSKASPEASFIEHLWGGAPRRDARGAANRVAIGPHIGNRVGHVQGGILLGLAAATACAAAPGSMMLSSASAWYISPGRGNELRIRSCILHAGRTTAVVRTEIKNADGGRVVEAVSHHVARLE